MSEERYNSSLLKNTSLCPHFLPHLFNEKYLAYRAYLPLYKLRVLLYFDHQLSAIEESSSWCVQRFYKNCQVPIARVAVVSNGDWSGWSDAFCSDQVKHFKVSEILQALHWTDEADL